MVWPKSEKNWLGQVQAEVLMSLSGQDEILISLWGKDGPKPKFLFFAKIAAMWDRPRTEKSGLCRPLVCMCVGGESRI